ncbi:MAG: peptide-methionine (S)-S-oxide reductase MsrA [Saprospiraceae bacterium]|nr:peptide-methionine (S)-S-oxide reductase MsrA [Saprospiraceae bacterium]
MKYISFVLVSFLLLATNCTSQGQNSEANSGKIDKNDKKVRAIGDFLKLMEHDYSQYDVATFAGGCFWCTEASFERIEGVVDVISGYSGGEKPKPTYYEVANGGTKHAESIQIYFDPEVITFEKLLDVFFVAHDPTQVNRQGPDVGPQYRSAIFYHNEAQKKAAQQFFDAQASKFSSPIATELSAYDEFWVAEYYHQNYYELNPNQGYIRNVSRPKVQKVEKTFAGILKDKYKK